MKIILICKKNLKLYQFEFTPINLIILPCLDWIMRSMDLDSVWYCSWAVFCRKHNLYLFY